MERLNLTMKKLKDLVRYNLSFLSVDFVSGSNGSVFPSLHLSSQPSSVAIYLNKSKKLLYEISHLNNNTRL